MIIFISDLHLSPERPKVTQAFLQFLKSAATDAEALYILGDLFDAWVGDDDDTPLNREVAKSLKNYSNQGTALFFMSGNRDFLLGQQYASSAGMTILQDPTIIDLFGKQALLLHGDSLCTNDRDYMSLRSMLRSPQWQQEALGKPLAERKALAAQLRSRSKSMTSQKPEDIMDVTPEEVEALMSMKQCPLMIHGHTHRPAKHTLIANKKAAERIVLGDWHDQGWYLAAKQNLLDLISFPIN